MLIKIINNDVLITTGVGNHQMMAAQFYRWTILDLF